MNDTTLERIVVTREAAHRAALDCYAQAQALIADGKRVRMLAEEDDDPITIKQRKFLHGAVFPQIAEQVRVNGERFVAKTWKEFFRVLFLERTPKYEMVKLPGYRKAVPRRVRQSTEGLSIKQYSEHIDRVMAHAATEFGVVFDIDPAEREAVRYVAPVRKAKTPIPEAEAATA